MLRIILYQYMNIKKLAERPTIVILKASCLFFLLITIVIFTPWDTDFVGMIAIVAELFAIIVGTFVILLRIFKRIKNSSTFLSAYCGVLNVGLALFLVSVIILDGVTMALATMFLVNGSIGLVLIRDIYHSILVDE